MTISQDANPADKDHDPHNHQSASQLPLLNAPQQPSSLVPDSLLPTTPTTSRLADLAPPSPSPTNRCPAQATESCLRPTTHAGQAGPSAKALRISTDIAPPSSHLSSFPTCRDTTAINPHNVSNSRIPLSRSVSASSVQLARTSSLKAAVKNSVISTQIVHAMDDVTPLPSPSMSIDSPGPWKRFSITSASPPQYRSKLDAVGQNSGSTSLKSNPHHDSNSSTHDPYLNHDPQPPLPSSKQLLTPLVDAKSHHTRNRSVSDYVAGPVSVQKRPFAVVGTHNGRQGAVGGEAGLRREAHLAESRGLVPTVAKPPTPPPSESCKDCNDATVRLQDASLEYFGANDRFDDRPRRWRSIGLIGRGTFSRVMLATSQMEHDGQGPEVPYGVTSECRLDRKTLVAVKVCEHGPRGGANADRIEKSLKRELNIMLSIHHPSVLDLKAWRIEATRAILVTSFCPSGDLFMVLQQRAAIVRRPQLMSRIVAEIVSAVGYLHNQSIAHRDIKLENVLVNVSVSELVTSNMDWAKYPYSVISLADFGLSRRFEPGEQLETRCGSVEYSAPEVIMGQKYDGCAIDAWSVGVLLYALLECRLPFDVETGISQGAGRQGYSQSRASHRIARVEWCWVNFAGNDGDHGSDVAKFEKQGLAGAMRIVEGLLRRAHSRWTLDKVAAEPWIANAVDVEGGIRFREEDSGEEVDGACA